jgi:hypothetical protein
MDKQNARVITILIIITIISLTGFEIISTNPGLFWIYGILTLIILVLAYRRIK